MPKKTDGFDPAVAAEANGVPFAGEDGRTYHPDGSVTDPDELPGIGLDKGDLFLDPRGREIPDPIPMAPPVGYRKQPSMAEIIREQIRGHRLAEEARAMGKETFEEADDFDVGDDYEPSSPWEEQFDPIGYAPGALQEVERRFQEAQAAKEAAVSAPPAPPQPKAPQGRPEPSEKATDSSAKPPVV